MLPDWYTKAGKDLDNLINKIAAQNIIDYSFVLDSKRIADGKNLILNSLLRIHDHVGVERREETLEFLRKIQPKKGRKSELKTTKPKRKRK